MNIFLVSATTVLAVWGILDPLVGIWYGQSLPKSGRGSSGLPTIENRNAANSWQSLRRGTGWDSAL